MQRYQIEIALDNGQLWAAMRNGRYWICRRNRRTQLWKTRPTEYRIPIKCGLKSYADVMQNSYVYIRQSVTWRDAHFVISADNPNNAPAGAMLETPIA